MGSTTTSAAPSATTTGSGNGNGNGSSASSSPLLFFVALGFGVVFTNLWIIVGVKYCFRYNQRNRAALGRGPHVDGDPIDLTVMARPHRRRREKRLMTVEDMNTRFPIMKYKAWRASREQEGLPSAGGITAPPSRAGSVKDADGIIGDIKLRGSSDNDRPGSSLSQTHRATRPNSPPEAIPEHGPISEKTVVETTDIVASDESKTATINAAPDSSIKPKAEDHIDASDDDEDEDPIADAASPEMITVPGDTCAICLDSLEDDDDVRGLTCGHAFHAACIEPWLTGRRASCPLCKADYYVAKPKPEGETEPTTTASRLRNHPFHRQQSPIGVRFMGRVPRIRERVPGYGTQAIRTPRHEQDGTTSTTEQVSSWRSRLPFGNRRVNDANSNATATLPSNDGSNRSWNPFRHNQTTTTSPTTVPTPAQMEAGTR